MSLIIRYRRAKFKLNCFLDEIYRKFNGGFYRNIEAAKNEVFRLTVCCGDDQREYDETTVRFDLLKKEIKMSTLSGSIRTLRYK